MDAAQAHHFEDDVPVPLLCECDTEDCQDYALVRIPAYLAGRDRYAFTAPGHLIEGAAAAEEAETYVAHLPGA